MSAAMEAYKLCSEGQLIFLRELWWTTNVYLSFLFEDTKKIVHIWRCWDLPKYISCKQKEV